MPAAVPWFARPYEGCRSALCFPTRRESLCFDADPQARRLAFGVGYDSVETTSAVLGVRGTRSPS